MLTLLAFRINTLFRVARYIQLSLRRTRSIGDAVRNGHRNSQIPGPVYSRTGDRPETRLHWRTPEFLLPVMESYIKWLLYVPAYFAFVSLSSKA